jgi:hypothetical protein
MLILWSTFYEFREPQWRWNFCGIGFCINADNVFRMGYHDVTAYVKCFIYLIISNMLVTLYILLCHFIPAAIRQNQNPINTKTGNGSKVLKVSVKCTNLSTRLIHHHSFIIFFCLLFFFVSQTYKWISTNILCVIQVVVSVYRNCDLSLKCST